MKKRYVLGGLLVTAVLGLAGYLLVTGKAQLLISYLETVSETNNGVGLVLLFSSVYIVATLLLLPASIFSATSGLLFGPFYGVLINSLAATLAAAIGFALTRRLAGTNEPEIKNKKIATLFKKVNAVADENGFKGVVVLRMLFLPYMGLSYAAGFVRKLKFSDFLLATLITNPIGGFAFVSLGHNHDKGLRPVLLSLGLIALTLLIPKLVKIIRGKKDSVEE